MCSTREASKLLYKGTTWSILWTLLAKDSLSQGFHFAIGVIKEALNNLLINEYGSIPVKSHFKKQAEGTWVAHQDMCLTLVQIMIFQDLDSFFSTKFFVIFIKFRVNFQGTPSEIAVEIEWALLDHYSHYLLLNCQADLFVS